MASSVTTRRQRILLVEDDAYRRAEVARVLTRAGFAVEAVATLEVACEVATAGPLDAILVDLLLPEVDELEALVRMRACAPKVPIVVQTPREDEELALRALQHGAQDYLTTGVIDSDRLLVRTIRYAIERGRHRFELEALTEALRAQNVELAALNAQKDRFLGIAAHDLRNPLGVVLGYTDLLIGGSAGALNDDQHQILSTIRSNAEYMLGLLEDLLDFSTIQAHGLRLNLEPTDLALVVRETVALERMLAALKGIEIRLQPPQELPLLSLDARKVRQVVENLLSNAIKFSHRGTAVGVELGATDEHVVITVRDHGVGIPRSELERLFRPFGKTSARGTGGERSTGLGLAIVYNIVVAHGGRIEVESEVGSGSTFRVLLPRAGPPEA